MAILKIKMDNIVSNFIKIKEICDKLKIELVTVTKVCLSNKRIVDILMEKGANFVADSYVENLCGLPTGLKKMLFTPPLSAIKLEKDCCDLFYLSDLEAIEAIGENRHISKKNILLPLELGDMREGLLEEELIPFLRKALKIKGVNIAGIGANLGCLIGKLPDQKVMEKLERLIADVKRELGFEFETVSMGGTLLFDMMVNSELYSGINQLRIGEAIFFGHNMSYNKDIPNLSQDTFIFSGEILEINEKNTDHVDNSGYNALGLKTPVVARGMRRLAVLDFGKLAAPLYGLTPLDSNITPFGCSHNHTVIDITEAKGSYKSGDYVDFRANYNSAAYAMIAPFVKKHLAEGECSF